MASLNGFDASTVPEQESFDALPEGQYVVIATDSEYKATKNGQGQYLQFTFEVIDGPYKGRKLWARLNLMNKNATAVEIANRELAAICRAVGIIRPNDSAELHNKPILTTVGVELDDRNRQSNVIKKYESATATAAGSMPPPPQQPAAQPAPAAAPWGQPAPGAAPWSA